MKSQEPGRQYRPNRTKIHTIQIEVEMLLDDVAEKPDRVEKAKKLARDLITRELES